MDISILYNLPGIIYGVTSTANYNPALPKKTWIRPLVAGDNPQDDFVYAYFAPDASKHTGVISKAAAALSNVQPVITPTVENPNPVTDQDVVAIPVNLAALPTGAKVAVNPMAIFGGLPVIQLPVPVSAPDPTASSIETRILAGINQILVATGKPTV